MISPPTWLVPNIQYEVMMGSRAYGVHTEDSDFDIYGWCIPRKFDVFPHLDGEIFGFGTQKKRFDQFRSQEGGVVDPSTGREYDITIYNIVKYFHLVMSNNPNMVDSLFVPTDCVLFVSQVAQRVREKRKIFLSKKAWHTFKGYAYSQLAKLKNKEKDGKRQAIIDQYGFDVKFAYHLVRLMNEVEQILEEGDLDLRRNNEQLKDIRRGNWTEQQVRDYFDHKEIELEKLYHRSSLQYSPDESAIKSLLIECLEAHYGNLEGAIEKGFNVSAKLAEIETACAEIRKFTTQN